MLGDPNAIPDTHSRAAIAVLVTALLATTVAVGWLLESFFADIIIALLFAGLLGQTYRKLVPRVGGRQPLAAFLVSTLFVIIVAIPMSFIVTSLSVEAADLFESTKGDVTIAKIEENLFGETPFARTAARIAQAAGFEYTPANVRARLTQVTGSVASFIYGQINSLLSNVVGFLYHFSMTVLFLFYFLIDGARLKAFMFRLSPIPDDEEELIVAKFKSVGRAIVFGNGVGSLIQGVLAAVAMSIFGVPSPVLWGIVMTIFAFLPLVGIMVVAIPAAIYLALNGHVPAAIAFTVYCTVVSLLVENIVKTKLIGSAMKMHSLVIFISILGGLSCFGVLGILYGPLLVTLFLTLVDLYFSRYRVHVIGAIDPTEHAS